MVQLATQRVTVPLWIITWLLGIFVATIAWAGMDRLTMEGEKATMHEWLRQLDIRLEKIEGKVDKLYELDSRRGSSQKIP